MLSLVLRSLWHYRRNHLVVAIAVLISTAVIGGALVVGDSIRYSLQSMSRQRLGRITHVLNSPRFVREALAEEIAQSLPAAHSEIEVHPALLLTGSVELTGPDRRQRRAGSVILLGVTSNSWPLLNTQDAPVPGTSGIVLGQRTASELQAKVGDEVSVWIERPSSIPRDSLLGEREDVNLELVLKVEAILEESAGASRFSLNPGQQLPYNAFVALPTLQERLGLERTEPSPRNPEARPARVNTLLVATAGGAERAGERGGSAELGLPETAAADLETGKRLSQALKTTLTAADLGLRLRPNAERGYVSVESDSMILPEAIAAVVETASRDIGMQSAPTLVYLANEIRPVAPKDAATCYSMYSIVAGLPFDRQPPLGPFRLQDGSDVPTLGRDDIVLSHWLSQDLQVSVGDVVEARWHEVGSHGDLPETRRQFTVRGILPEDDAVSVDPGLTPFVEGVTNVDSFGDWDQPFDMEMDRITDRDDDYWAEYRATPKAFVSLETAEALWSSRFGQRTSMRIGVPGTALSEDRLAVLSQTLESEICRDLDPVDVGLFFRPVRLEGLQAAVGANDFSVLFLGFSFFLIVSAILLAALMYRLGIQQRIAQVGLLEAIGFTPARARWMFLSEGLVVALLGAVAGAFAAVGFAKLMIYGLTSWWVGAIGTRFLLLHVQPQALVLAAVVSLLLAAAVMWWTLRAATRRPPRELLMGMDSEDMLLSGQPRTWRQTAFGVLAAGLILTAIGLPAALLTDLVPSQEAFGGISWRVAGFFLAGFSWLMTGLLLLRNRLQSRRQETVNSRPIGSVWALAIASAARNPQRSLLTTALIAFATFVIVAVGAGRRNPVSELPDRHSGNGGFSLVAEASQPILFDLNTADGRQKLQLDRDDVTTLPDQTRVFAFAMQPGQDASCLNLYQTTVPTLLGAAPDFIQRGGFRFADTPGENPWERLGEVLPDRDELPVIPVIGDLNTLQFSLKKGMGDVILYPGDGEPAFALQIVGMLDSSIFQGVVVMSDVNLKRVAPDVSGARYFLVETPAEAMARTASVLETGLNAFGVDTEPVTQRLAGFLAVQNTYLTTFQLLGGLGLLVGTFGLAAVMLRNVMERRAEIALLKALGFTTGRVMSLILIENTVLLFWGILTGTVSALMAMLPHLLSTGADVPWLPLGLTLVAVGLVGSLAAIFPVQAAVRTSIRENLAAA